jgi:hypothetical protein
MQVIVVEDDPLAILPVVGLASFDSLVAVSSVEVGVAVDPQEALLDCVAVGDDHAQVVPKEAFVVAPVR